ncbi:MAG TPA: PrpF domain-containing protein [Thermodesulfobacteriota bacterium]|nr:PrpF domain-containing protein [Thermodesulfobacteriota bacterium]
MKMLRCVIIRGGTSRGVYFHENELPPDRQLRDKIILDVFGSPDVREIDGLGGADILTSKVCIIGPSKREDADVDYTFGQVIIDKPIVDYSINCGNLSSGVGPFAIDEGLVKPIEPITTVRIYNTNTKKILVAEVPVKDGKAVVEGDYHIDGVPGTGAKIALDFAATAGTIKGTLLPTGKVREVLSIDEIGEIEVSIVDAANPTVFAFAEDIGIKGTERFQDLLADSEVWRKAEMVRGAAAEILGFVKDRKNSAIECPAAPFSAFISRPSSYINHVTGEEIKAEDVDLRSIIWAARQVHKAYAVTGTICTGAAAMIEGTIVNEVLSQRAKQTGIIWIGHPAGRIDVEVEVQKEGDDLLLKKAALFRTARRIMEGYVYLKPWTLAENINHIRSR